MAITYGTANRGMCHIHPLEAMVYDMGKMDFNLQPFGLENPDKVDRWDEEGKGKAVKILQDGCILPDILVNCKFMIYRGLTFEHIAEIVSGSTGWEMSVQDLLNVGDRTINLQRLFNQREGFDGKNDKLPQRVLSVPAFGNYKNENRCGIKDFDKMLTEYYQARGWCEDGTLKKSDN